MPSLSLIQSIHTFTFTFSRASNSKQDHRSSLDFSNNGYDMSNEIDKTVDNDIQKDKMYPDEEIYSEIPEMKEGSKISDSIKITTNEVDGAVYAVPKKGSAKFKYSTKLETRSQHSNGSTLQRDIPEIPPSLSDDYNNNDDDDADANQHQHYAVVEEISYHTEPVVMKDQNRTSTVTVYEEDNDVYSRGESTTDDMKDCNNGDDTVFVENEIYDGFYADTH